MLRTCTVCHDQCFFATVEARLAGRQTLATSRKALLADLVRRGSLDWTPTIVDALYAGLQSGVQHGFCVHHGAPDGWPDESAFLRAARADLVEAGAVPPYVAAIRDAFAQTGNPFGYVGAEEIRPGEPILFVDAVTRALQPEIASAARHLLRQLAPMHGEVASGCSGYELHELGLRRDARQAGADTLAALSRAGGGLVITESPEAAYAMRCFYPALGLAAPSVVHLSRWLADRLATFGPRLAPRPPLPATYHDADRLGRGLGEYDAPRALLAAIPGLTLVEMRYHHEQALPAGPALGYPWPELATAIAAERAQEAVEVGAKLIVTASPYDKRNLRPAAAFGLAIQDLVEVIAHSLPAPTSA